MPSSNVTAFDVVARMRELETLSPEARAAALEKMGAGPRDEDTAQRRRRAQELYHASSEVPADLREHRLASFRPRPDQVKAFEVVKSWALSLPENLILGRGIWFVAPPNRGKSAILCALLNSLPDLVDKHFPGRAVKGLYINWANLIWDSKGEELDVHALAKRAMLVDFLLLDEIGTKRDTPTTGQFAYRVLEHRLQNHKPTFFITNADPDELVATFGAQEVRRMKAMVPKPYRIAWVGEDYEPEGTQLELVKGGR